jgi:hypothetical protein
VWVVAEQRSTGERKYYLSNLPADVSYQRQETLTRVVSYPALL